VPQSAAEGPTLIYPKITVYYKIRSQKMKRENTQKCIVFVKEASIEQDIVFFGKTLFV
jgi:hypothetical protein